MPGDRPPITGGLNVTEEGDRLQAAAEVNLGRAAAEVPVADQIALRDQALRERDQDLRDWMTKEVMPAFLTANRWTLYALGVLVVLDEFNALFSIAPRITSQVVMALLGATTVQVGVIAVTIARYLFPGRR